MIELRQVSKRFGKRDAVIDLNLEVKPGSIFGLLGHNGAGKSTTIGMLLGQVWPSAGSVKIFGAEVSTHRAQALRRVGAIFEAPVFYDYLSGWRNLQILAHYTAPTPARRLAEVIEWVGLTGRERSAVRTYSHGMRARLALAQALLPAPDLLILDEPSDGLDPEGIHEMRLTIHRLQRELGLTILLSSHLLNEVEQLCTEIAVLKQGRKVFEGNLADVKRRTNFIRFRTDNDARALLELQNAGLAQPGPEAGLLVLKEGEETDVLAEFLVTRGYRLLELVRQEQTVESFYLSLMKPATSSLPST